MRNLLTTAALAVILTFASDSAFGFHHRAQVAYAPGPMMVSSQGFLPPNFFNNLLPGLLGQLPFLPGTGGNPLSPGQLLPATPVPADVATRLNDVDSKLSDSVKQAHALNDEVNPPTVKQRKK